MEKKEIILVDNQDKAIGAGGKMQVHLEGKLHRSFSVLVFDPSGKLLIQKRADKKYHSPGIWSNTCCSHPRPNMDIKNEAERRLKEEMGIECDLKEVFNFTYKRNLGKLTEHEVDHVFFGKFKGSPNPSPDEVSAWRWVAMADLEEDVGKNPDKYAYWFLIILKKIKEIQK